MQPMQLVLGSFELPVDLAIRNSEVCGALRFSGVFGSEIVQPFARGARSSCACWDCDTCWRSVAR